MQINRLVQLCKDDYGFSDVQPFVFSFDTNDVIFEDEDDSILACPFQKFSIELDGDHGLVGCPIKREGYEESDFIVRCIVVNELSPNVYDLVVLAEIWSDDEKVGEFSVHYPPKENNCISEFRPVIREYLNRLHTGDTGTFVGSGKVRYRVSGKKATYRPGGVIYVGKKSKHRATNGGHIIDWSNSWNVMAHWRRLSDPESLGMDRAGNRTVEGYTWISNYVKGDGPLSNKVRIVNAL